MEYELTRSKRKTQCIAVSKEGKLIVRAPLRLPVRAIEAFLAEKSDWIREKMALHRQISDEKIKFQLAEGSLLPFLGKEYPIRIGRDALLIEEEILLPGNDLYKEAEAFYRQEARRLLPEKAAFWGEKMGLTPQSISVTGAKTRWGSCSAKGNLNFSWRLMRAPQEAVDYVVVHELAHLKELNHSKAFWNIVKAVMPDWEYRRELLIAVQRRLETEGWNH